MPYRYFFTIYAAFTLLFGATCAATPLADSSATQSLSVIIIPVSGDVEPGMAAFIGRAIREGLSHKKPLLILEMDTFGGRVDAAFQIVDTMLGVPDSIRTVAFVKNKAISAGALIALSCRSLAMKPNTTIGDCAPIAISNEGAQMLGEKFQSPLRAKFRALAHRNGISETLAEAMVSTGKSIYKVNFADTTLYLDSVELAEMPAVQKKRIKSKAVVVSGTELLTMSDKEAAELGFSAMSAASIEEFLEKSGISNYTIVRVEENWSETLVRCINKIAPILMMIGFAALYIEFKTPGFGFPGIIGIMCIATVFLGQYMVGLAHYTELLIILLGITLIGIEIFVTPGMLVLGIAGGVAIAIGLVLSLQGFVIPDPAMPWEQSLLINNLTFVVGNALLAGVISMLFLRFALPRLGLVVKGPYLNETLTTSHADSDEIHDIAVGDVGRALTLLRPAGKAVIKSQSFDVITSGEFLDKATEIVVVEVSRSKIIVARKTTNVG
jgi:membrane-bound serine protease (ClpP class)